MIPMDTESALRKRSQSRGDDGHLYLLRDPSRDRDGQDPRQHREHREHREHPATRQTNGVGSIQIVRPARDAVLDAAGVPLNNGLAAARGIALAVVLGLGFWTVVGSLIGALFL